MRTKKFYCYDSIYQEYGASGTQGEYHIVQIWLRTKALSPIDILGW